LSIGDPQAEQNLAPTGISDPHREQTIATS
jgi:hypothetical protein